MQATISALQKHVFNATPSSLHNDSTKFEILQTSQEIRSRLSSQAFGLVLVVALVYIWGLWNYTNQIQLILWCSSVTLIAAIRAWYSRRLLRRLSTATPETLLRNEAFLFMNGAIYSFMIGAAYWLIALDSDVRTVFAVTTMSSMYAIGTTANSSIHFRTFAIFTLLNLLQGVAFFLFDSRRVDIPIVMTIVVSLILLLRFGHRNAELFQKSVTRRLENVEQNIQLLKNQHIIEASLSHAKETNKSKSRFLAAASHDLRQPLHALSLFMGSLRNTKTSPEQVELLDYIQQSADTLTTQFNSLLDLSQLDSGFKKTNIVKFDLHPIMQNLVDALSLDAAQHNIEIKYDGEQTIVHNDPILLDRVIRNILTNALKYTEAGSITIYCKDSGSAIDVSITDTGCGIAEHHQDFIFEEFAQVGNPERQSSEGTGLGLAIVRRISAMLGITVTVDSTEGQGSTFKLSIPYTFDNTATSIMSDVYSNNMQIKETANNLSPTRNAAPIDLPDTAVLPNKLDGMNLLLVDDDQHILDAFSHLLEARGATVFSYSSYQAAIAIEEPTKIDLAFIDDMLETTGSGLDIANWLAGFINKRHIVLVTGSEKTQRIEDIRANGFSVYIKPLSISQLDAILLSRLALQRR